MFPASKHILLLAGGVLVITAVVFYPALFNGFTNWDDRITVTSNLLIRDFSPAGIKNIFTNFHHGLYSPLVLSILSVEYHFFGADPFVYHLGNVLLHLCNCALVFWLIMVLSENVTASALTALFFGIHPLHVEPVAWVTEMKELLFAFFFILALLGYAYYLKKGLKKSYFFSLGAFFLSLLTKPMGVTFPFVIILIDYLQNVKEDKIRILEKLPFFILSSAVVVFYCVWRPTYSIGNFDSYNILASFQAVLFYLKKLLLPARLSCLYPVENIAAWPALTFYISAFLLLAGILLFFSSRLDRKWVFGLLFFLVAIFPSLPVIKAATKFIAADRYTYIPSIGIFYAASEFFARGFKQKSGHIFLLVVILVFATLAIETRQRTKVWQDSVALWSDVIAKYPRAWLAYVNRGESFDDKKEYKRALADYDAAIAINPGCATVYNNRAVSYYYLGEYDLSWRDIKKATAMGYLAHPGFIAALKKASGKAGVDGI